MSFGVESINKASMSQTRACNSRIVYMLYDGKLYMLKCNKIYVILIQSNV